MMLNFPWIMASAAAEMAEEEGIGLNLDILGSNIINLAILIGILVYFGRKVLGNILSERRAKIAAAIQEAEVRQKEAALALAEQQTRLTQAQAEAEKIRQAAQERAETVKQEILAQAEADIARMRETATKDLDAQQDRVMAELKQRIAALALERVTGQLGNYLNSETQRQIIDRGIAQLGG